MYVEIEASESVLGHTIPDNNYLHNLPSSKNTRYYGRYQQSTLLFSMGIKRFLIGSNR
jgi:hypothetical protein